MPTPAFVDAGAGSASGSGTSLAVNYPATVNANDFLVVHVYTTNSSSITTPSGWTSIASASSGFQLWHAYYKLAAGTEGGGTLTVSFSFQNTGAFARIYRFTGGGIEGAAGVATASSTTIADQGVTTSGNGRLAVNLVALAGSRTIGNFTGMTGGTWAEAVAEYTSTVGNDATLQVQTASIATATTINGGTTSISPSALYSVLGFAIVPGTTPIGLATETDTAFPVTTTKGAVGLRAVLGIAAETDTALAVTVTTGGPNLDFAIGVDFGNGYEDLGSSETGDSRMRSATVTRGRTFNLDVVEAGTADIIFQNADAYLDPSNADGPWYGHILPINPIRVFRRLDNVTYQLLSGVVERYTPQWQPPNYQDVEVQASDNFDTLSSQNIVSGISTLTTVLGGNKDLTYTAVDAGENGDNITVTYVVSGAGTTLSTSVNQPLTGNGIVSGTWIQRPGLSIPVGPTQPVGQTSGAVPISVGISGSDITVNLATSGSTVSTSTASQVLTALQADPDVSALVTIALAPGSSGAGTVPAMGQTNLAGGKWPSELSGTRINRVLDLVGWDPTARAIDDGISLVAERGFAIVDNASALSHIQEVADAELGYFFMAGDGTATFHDGHHRATATRSTTVQAVFSDDGTGFSYVAITPTLDMDRIVNQATVTSSADNAVAQTVNDTYSQAGTGSAPTNATAIPPRGFGIRTIQRSTQLASDTDALTQAQTIVGVFAYPSQRFDEITSYEPDILSGGGSNVDYGSGLYGALAYGATTESTAWATGVLGLEIGDLITVRTTPPANDTTTAFNAYVEQITDTVAPGQPWARTLKLSPVSQSVSGGGGGGGGSPGAMLNTIGGNLVLDDATNGVIG